MAIYFIFHQTCYNDLKDKSFLTFSQTTNFIFFQIERVCTRQLLNSIKMAQSSLNRIEKIVGKGEIACSVQYLFFSHSVFERHCRFTKTKVNEKMMNDCRHFLLFQQCFLPFKNKLTKSHLFSGLQTLSILTKLTFHLVKRSGCLNPFPHNDNFWRPWETSLLKTLWEKEKLLLFPQCFLPVWITCCHIRQIWNCRLQTLSVWKSLKFVVW